MGIYSVESLRLTLQGFVDIFTGFIPPLISPSFQFPRYFTMPNELRSFAIGGFFGESAAVTPDQTRCMSMAQIILSGEELVCILVANGLVPDEVADVTAEEDQIRIKVRTPWPVLKSIRVGMRFAGFEQGEAILQVVTNRVIDRFDWLVDKMLASFPLAEHCARWEYPKLYLDVNTLLHRQVRGVEIANIVFEEGQYRIATAHAMEDLSRNTETPDEPDPFPPCPDSV